MLVDIHHHLIWGVDDGAKTEEETQKMILRAVEQGVSHIVCTSHATPGVEVFPAEDYLTHFAQAQDWIAQQQLPITLHTGCEVLYTDASPRLLKEGFYPSLAEMWVTLVEFSGDVTYERLCEAARKLGNVGFSVVFAHVERYEVLRDLKRVRELREEYGVAMQVNANTILQKKGFFTDRWVKKMLEGGLVDCVATDAHNASSRPCQLRDCYEKLKATYGEDMADDLCGGFQQQLLRL